MVTVVVGVVVVIDSCYRSNTPAANSISRTRSRPQRATIGLPMTIAPNDFTHLHVHSEFSLLDGLGRITELVDTAAQLGMDSMAITDHGALYGAVAFYQAARNKGIKPIIGVETYVARRSMTEKEGKADAQPFTSSSSPGLVCYPNLSARTTPTSTVITTIHGTTAALAKDSEGLIACRRVVARSPRRSRWRTELAAPRRRVLRILGGTLLPRVAGPRHADSAGSTSAARLAPEAGLPGVTRPPYFARTSPRPRVCSCVGTGTI